MFLFSEGSSAPLGPIQPMFIVYRGAEDKELTTHPHMFLRLKMNGGINTTLPRQCSIFLYF